MFISNPGHYEGYSEEKYDGWQRFSQYVSSQDGTKLAIDIFQPTKNKILHKDPLPVVWTAVPYQRAAVNEDGSISTILERWPFLPMGVINGTKEFIKHGYIVAAMDLRGTGSSFGFRSILYWQENDINDLYSVNEWLAGQEWCNRKTGMFGLSWYGISQYLTAISGAPSLKCIVPEMHSFDMPSQLENGVDNCGWFEGFNKACYDFNVIHPAPPVDEDHDGVMLKAAIEEHKKNPSGITERVGLPYHDSYSEIWHTRLVQQNYFPKYIYDINHSGVAVYHWEGWKDFFTMSGFQWYNNLKTPKRLVYGPWYHARAVESKGSIDWTVEHLRWYDYWLKGIDNGIMNEPPIWLYTYGASEGKEWQTAWQWPLHNEKPVNFYLNAGYSGSVNSVNDGVLSTLSPQDFTGKDEYRVDYTISTTGFVNRWDMGLGPEQNRTLIDQKSLTYTTRPLPAEIELTGYPIMHLWVSSIAKNLDFFAYLEEIDEKGISTCISEGQIRASVRATSTPVFDNMGNPWHSNRKKDHCDLPSGEPVELSLTMQPLSNIIYKGHRLRITINNFDKGNWNTPELSPVPTVSVYRNNAHASYVKLPVIDKNKEVK
jgi:putative CocE/NonD family hydrolase